MDTARLTFARIVAADTGGDVPVYTVSVSTPSGDVTFERLVPSSSELIWGGLLGTSSSGYSFVPFAFPGGDTGGGGGPGSGGATVIKAFLGLSVAIGGDAYEYQFEEATGSGPPSTWETKPDGVTGVCYNTAEGGNVQGLMYSGIDRANLGGGTEPFAPVPFAPGTPVILIQSGTSWYFTATQAVDGVCEGGA